MARPELLKHFSINLDLALEAHEAIRGQVQREIPGVAMEKLQKPHATVTIVTVLDAQGEQLMGKPPGKYITIEAPDIREGNRLVQAEIARVFADQLKSLLSLGPDATVLLVGLGNWKATPDALGPRVINSVLVTRHLFHYAPQELAGGMRPVCALAPGVLGITGIETAEIIRGVVDRVKPNAVICIDALAAGSAMRIGTTIQLADTGISPGSGLGHKRQGLNQETLGVPVIAIGIPTVCHAAVIAGEAIDKLLEQFQTSPTLYQIYKNLNPAMIQQIINEVLHPFAGNLVMTPKDIDDLISECARIVAGGLNLALHPGIPEQEAFSYLH
ncbi:MULTISPECIES: GPR endopeptidase [Carboxydocella]|uniref:Germination protease n=2 Tax=Carboxydocella TaxID=178898 RepID=A0A1T4N8Q5_9FIRM|nr:MULTISPECIES: GPR endopeptidase [Carboxydocella]AVX20948.1 spore protease [Carboxydocella thermautotrophica]AVX31362.1 spore protease [Carboxydocella thermautotrophica]GAW32514.1 GPR endopeptidase [Carboxydocella sp. JDF658]SJZ75602.1 spore protease [Carboxydocella sporoproducens DSM 16521]